MLKKLTLLFYSLMLMIYMTACAAPKPKEEVQAPEEESTDVEENAAEDGEEEAEDEATEESTKEGTEDKKGAATEDATQKEAVKDAAMKEKAAVPAGQGTEESKKEEAPSNNQTAN